MPDVTGNAVHQSTKRGLTSAENVHEPSGNTTLSQAQPLQSTMSPLPLLLPAVLSLSWPTWPLPLLLTVKQWQT
jgi:hypothetical protein